MFESLLALGGLFWLISLVTLFGLITTVHGDNPSPAGFVVILFLGIVGLLWSKDSFGSAWEFILTNPWIILKWFSVYVGIGVLYAVARMYFYLSGLRRKLLDFRARRSEYKDSDRPLEEKDLDKFKKEARLGYKAFPPRVSEYKSEITGWLVTWPLCWVELRPLSRFFTYVYSSIAGGLQSMSDRMFKGLA